MNNYFTLRTKILTLLEIYQLLSIPRKGIPDRGLYYKIVNQEPDIPFKLVVNNDLTAWRASTFFTKEPETLEWIRKFSHRDGEFTFLDVGANVGIYSLYFLSLNPKGEAVCCEPFSPNIKLLNENIRLNNFSNRARVVETPLSSIEESGYAHIGDERPGGSGYKFNNEVNFSSSSPQTETTTIDRLIVGKGDKVIVKIDTDGSDFGILQGGLESLANGKIASVLIESDAEEQKKIEKFLSQFHLLPDQSINFMSNHSDFRRIDSGKIERNRVYSRVV